MISRVENRLKRKTRARRKMFGDSVRPRLSFYRSNRHLFVQIIDDEKGKTLVSAGDNELAKKGTEKTKMTRPEMFLKVGELVAEKAVKKGVKKVVLDRGGFRYHGLVTKFVEGARKGGLDF